MAEINIFEFATPAWLWLMVVAPLLLVIHGLLQLYRGRKLRKFGNIDTLKGLIPNYNPARGWFKVSILALTVVFLSLAAARPRTGVRLRAVESSGREIVLVVDVSNSMYAEDVEPSRMERTRYAITRLIEGMQEDRVGIVAFADRAEVVLPITGDYKMARAKAAGLSPALIAHQGTDIAEALEVAMLSFSSATESSRSRVIILITDGENHDEGAVDVAERAKAEGVMICTIGIGTPEGTVLEINGEAVEEDGKMVVTKLNETLLQELAEKSDGIYRRSRNDSFGLEDIVERLDQLERAELTMPGFAEYDEEYQWFLGVALLLLVVECLIFERRNPLLRGIHLFEREN